MDPLVPRGRADRPVHGHAAAPAPRGLPDLARGDRPTVVPGSGVYGTWQAHRSGATTDGSRRGRIDEGREQPLELLRRRLGPFRVALDTDQELVVRPFQPFHQRPGGAVG